MEVLFSADVPGDHYVSDDEDEEDPDDRYPREYIFPLTGVGIKGERERERNT